MKPSRKSSAISFSPTGAATTIGKSLARSTRSGWTRQKDEKSQLQEGKVMSPTNAYPKLHNAAWPGVVGKGSPGAEPFIDLDTMLDLTAKAEVDGVRFDGVDLFLFAPNVDIDSSDDDLKRLADKVRSRNLVIGSVVAPVWPPTGGGSAMGD